MKKVTIGLLGCGTIGTGVAKMLIEHEKLISSRVGAYLHLKHVADIDTQKDRGIDFDKGVFITDAYQVIDDPEIDIIIEMIGGEGIAKDLILKAIENGKHIVTANKALLANQGNTIFKSAWEKGVDIAYEASVGGCMPIIKTIRESLGGDHINAVAGILNGTCNYILSKITDNGDTFKDALAQAQAIGLAEADPSLDVEGIDTAHKLAIIAALAYGMEINMQDIYIEGISDITPMDIEFAGDFGYIIKLLAISKNNSNTVEARVHPTMIPCDNLLSKVSGSMNAVTVSGDGVGDILLSGHGAGMMPTATIVIGDVIDIVRNLISGGMNRIPLLSYQMENIRKIPILPIEDLTMLYYFRFLAADRPSVLAKISGVLGEHNISIKSVHQKGKKIKGAVPVVMLTHLAREAGVQKALAEITALDVVIDKPMVIRIEDEDRED